MKIGILGLGEVGQAIKEVYLNNPKGKEFEIVVCDKAKNLYQFEVPNDEGDVMQYLHICLPYNEKFEDLVEAVCKKYNPGITIIHSTVKVGTTKRLNDKVGRVVHSPIRGVHPKLYEGVKTFVKYIGYDEFDVGNMIATHFSDDLGLDVGMFENSKTTELGKLLSTTYYGMAIAFHNYTNKICKENGLDFDKVMTDFNGTYNEGYKKLGKENVIRPVLYAPEDGKIGGHCIIPNAKILKEQFGDSEVLKMILDLE